MTPSRKRMLEDLQLRNLSQSTIETYIALIERFGFSSCMLLILRWTSPWNQARTGFSSSARKEVTRATRHGKSYYKARGRYDVDDSNPRRA